jgi:REP element-mobilizing transposase RayT
MPGTYRASRGGFVYHVLNRRHGLSDVFHKDDFSALVNLMRAAREKVPMRLIGFCLMTNHFHLLLWRHEDGDLSRWDLTSGVMIVTTKAADMSGRIALKHFQFNQTAMI